MKDDHEYAIRPNKTQIKREIKVLNNLGKQLVGLPANQLASIELSDEMRAAINDAKRFSKGALQRQLRRIASLMQNGEANLQEELIEKFPEMDIQHFRQLVRNAQREFAANKAPKSARALFKMLRDLDDQSDAHEQVQQSENLGD